MKCFPLVKTVLDEVYEQVPGQTDAEKDKRIEAALEVLHDQYTQLLTGVHIDYSDSAIRFAYIYRYVTSHANIVYQRILSSPELQKIFDATKVTVACIGGGPGSDFLGILKFTIQQGKISALKCFLFDREAAWGESWSDVDDKLGTELRVSTYFQQFDVTKPDTWQIHTKYLQADLFTMIYFVSEIFSAGQEAAPYFVQMFQKAKCGSYFLYVDNKESSFRRWFDGIAKNHDLELVAGKSVDVSLGAFPDENKEDLGKYYDKFGWPKMKAAIDYRIYRKPCVI